MLKPNSFETIVWSTFGPTVYVWVGNARESCREEDGTKVHARHKREKVDVLSTPGVQVWESKSSKHSQTNQFQT